MARPALRMTGTPKGNGVRGRGLALELAGQGVVKGLCTHLDVHIKGMYLHLCVISVVRTLVLDDPMGLVGWATSFCHITHLL